MSQFNIFHIISAFFCIPMSVCVASNSKPEKVWRLSDVVQNRNLAGFAYDSKDDQAVIEKEVDDYILFRKGRLSRRKVKGLERKCQNDADLAKNPFCPLIFGETKKSYNGGLKTHFFHRRAVSTISRALRKGDIQLLLLSDEEDLNRALKRIHRFKALEPLIQKVLNIKECSSSDLFTAFGLRVENEFPDQKYRALAASLYEKSSQCGQTLSSVEASYRLGLMRIWDGHCDQAEPVLSRIPGNFYSKDYLVRTAYWRYYCADQLKNSLLKDKLKAWFLKEYPLSFHGLLVDSTNSVSDLSSPTLQDPEVSFRSEFLPKLNGVTGAIESLLIRGEKGAASDLLEQYLDQIAATETSFQLYWAVLLLRAGDRPASFQLMANIFRENSNLISKNTLQLVYPLQEIDLIRNLNASIDPYLVVSLIRQESAFDTSARSPAGAMGLMQLQLATARHIERRLSRKQLYDPRINIRVGIKYFTGLLKRYDGRVDLALAAYNAGPQRIKDWNKRYPIDNRLLFLDLLPIRETRDYVTSIARNYYWYLKLYSSQPESKPSPGISSAGPASTSVHSQGGAGLLGPLSWVLEDRK